MSLICVLEYFFNLPIRFQPFDSERDSITFLSGKAPSTRKGLLVTMGIFMSLAILGMIAEIVFRTARKAKVQNGEGTLPEILLHSYDYDCCMYISDWLKLQSLVINAWSLSLEKKQQIPHDIYNMAISELTENFLLRFFFPDTICIR